MNGRTRSALAVMLTTLGFAPTGPRLPAARTEPLRRSQALPESLGATLSTLVAGDPQGLRLLLVHGTPGSAEGWADHLLEPPAGIEVVALDRPGFGRSGPEDARVRLADQAAAVAALLPRVRAPVLIVHGSDDELVPVANVRYMQARLSGARCCVARLLPGRNHFLPWNAEPDVRAAIAWAASVPC